MRDRERRLIETPGEMFERVARAVAQAEGTLRLAGTWNLRLALRSREVPAVTRDYYAIVIVCRLDFSSLGSVSSSIPSFIEAFAFESSTAAGSSTVRVNAPREISQR